MIRARVLFAFATFNLLLLAFSLLVGFTAYNRAGNYLADNSMFISSLRGGHFSEADIKTARAVFPDLVVEEHGRVVITAAGRQAISPAIFCEANYFNLHFMNFMEGAPWHQTENSANLIVINEALAWYLFGGANVTGLIVEINSDFYQVIGVVCQNFNQGKMAWLPIGVSPQIATAMYIQMDDYNAVDARARVVYLLENQLFRRAADYSVIDVNRYVESIAIRFRILLHGLQLFILILLVRMALRRPFKKAVVFWVLTGLCVISLLGVSDILLWLPGLYGQGLNVFTDLSNAGIMPMQIYLSYGLRQIWQWNWYANLAWVAGVMGFFNLLFVWGMVE